MRFRTLAAAILLVASANASAANLVTSLVPTGVRVLSPLLALTAPLGAGNSLLGSGSLLVLPNLSGGKGLPPLPALSLPGLIPLPAVPIPVTDILASVDGIPTTVALLRVFAPFTKVVFIPVVSPILDNF